MTVCPNCKTSETIETAYSAHHDPDLPWGYWFRADRDGTTLIDEAGVHWPSIRTAFWHGRLGMKDAGPWLEQQFELLTAVLYSTSRKFGTTDSEIGRDVLGTSPVVAAHYMAWLEGHGLIVGRRPDRGRALLTDEGRASLVMLKATRPEELIDVKPGSDAIQIAGGPTMAHVANPQVNVAGAQYVFKSEMLARQPAITLVDRDGVRGRMPMQKTIWSCTFANTLERDRLFAWMCGRSDRWQAWGGIAERSADGLTQHLLATYIASVDWTEPCGGKPMLAIAHCG